MQYKDTDFGKEEKDFLAKLDFKDFVGNMEVRISEADYQRPDLMFVKFSLVKDRGTVVVVIEADERLIRRYFDIIKPCQVSRETLCRFCAALSIEERRDMLKKLPILAEKHERAYALKNDIIE